jgi:hypothetical protein
VQVDYPLEQLFVDQDPALVIDAIPAVLAWAPAKQRKLGLKFDFTFKKSATKPRVGAFSVGWKIPALEAHDPTVVARASRMREGTTPLREHLVEVAGYGLALCAISAMLPGRKVVGWSRYAAPDVLFDNTPGAIRGVEVAARSAGGAAKLRELESQKKPPLIEDADVAEAWLSLWSREPEVGWFVRVKP